MPNLKITPKDMLNVDLYDDVDVRVQQAQQVPVQITGLPSQEEKVSVNIKPPDMSVNIINDKKRVFEFQLNVRSALNGDFMIFDHKDIDIMIIKEKKKIVAFAKDMMSEAVYGAENRLFNHLRKKGIVAYDSIKGGSVYGSLEALMLEAKDKKEPEVLDLVLYQISEWMKNEKPHFETDNDYDDLINDYYSDPEEDQSTELGEVPHEEEKGSIRQHGLFAPYLYGRYTY